MIIFFFYAGEKVRVLFFVPITFLRETDLSLISVGEHVDRREIAQIKLET